MSRHVGGPPCVSTLLVTPQLRTYRCATVYTGTWALSGLLTNIETDHAKADRAKAIAQ